MRYVLWLCLLVGALPALGYDEVVSAVSYNPSLSGGYTHLKVVETATFEQGLSLTDSTANVVQNVSIKDNDHNCSVNDTTGLCDNSINMITHIVPDSDTGATQTSASGGILQGPSHVVKNNCKENSSCNRAKLSEGLTVHMKGGTLGSSSAEWSYIGDLTGAEKVDITGEFSVALVTGPPQVLFLGNRHVDISGAIKPKAYGLSPRVDRNGKMYQLVSFTEQ